mmetsp:Transcript_43539/g.114946  ORF Transcript_43539/g.114946 Transcript_43539/m.114946 type:complete len:259 (+) Transcript_43539:248-1024(+)
MLLLLVLLFQLQLLLTLVLLWPPHNLVCLPPSRWCCDLWCGNWPASVHRRRWRSLQERRQETGTVTTMRARTFVTLCCAPMLRSPPDRARTSGWCHWSGSLVQLGRCVPRGDQRTIRHHCRLRTRTDLCHRRAHHFITWVAVQATLCAATFAPLAGDLRILVSYRLARRSIRVSVIAVAAEGATASHKRKANPLRLLLAWSHLFAHRFRRMPVNATFPGASSPETALWNLNLCNLVLTHGGRVCTGNPRWAHTRGNLA